MESFPVESLILVILASIVAFLIGRMTSKGREDSVRLQGELEESRKDFQDFRKQVTSHFRGTAQRVDALTESYRDVYKHLAQGAQELCEKSEAPQLLEELKPNPMLGGETEESPEVDSTEASAEPESEHAQPEREPEQASENSSESAGDAIDESGAKPTSNEKAQDEAPADSEADLKDEPEAAAKEPVETETQKPVRESAL